MPAAFTASTSTYLWKERLAAAIDEIADAGYQGVELMAAPPHVELWATADRLPKQPGRSAGVRASTSPASRRDST